MRQGDDGSREENTKGRGLRSYLADHHTVCLLCDEMCEANGMPHCSGGSRVSQNKL